MNSQRDRKRWEDDTEASFSHPLTLMQSDIRKHLPQRLIFRWDLDYFPQLKGLPQVDAVKANLMEVKT